MKQQLQKLEERLAVLEQERAELLSAINQLRNNLMTDIGSRFASSIGRPIMQCPPVTPQEKIELFLKLFRCRENLFPKRWENNKSGKAGYSPVCDNEWVKSICQKPKIKCTDCAYQKFPPLDQNAVEKHLKGLITIGTYAIREDDTCTFLASDFDEKSGRKMFWLIDRRHKN